MFQYALGRKLALQNKDTLKLEIEGLNRANKIGDIYRSFGLGHFNIQKNIASYIEVQKLKYPYKIFSKGFRWFNFKVLRNTHIIFEPTVLNWRGDIFLDGYWQSPKYFDDIRTTLLSDFTLSEPLSPAGSTFVSQIQSTESVSIHIRRGDYIKNPKVLKEFGVCSLTYYSAAIKCIVSRHPSSTFFIFSDDIPWVKENLEMGDKAVFVSDQSITDFQELILMSTCKHNIIANSSFSWWGAWLNQNPNKTVIAPTPWFESAEWDRSLLPKPWIKLQK